MTLDIATEICDNGQWRADAPGRPNVNEVPDILNRALEGPLALQFGSPNEARTWVYRAHNFVRRHAPHLRQLMISRRGDRVEIRVPQISVTEL